MSFPAVVDRRVSTFLDTPSFVKVRALSRVHWQDQDAWRLFAQERCSTLANALCDNYNRQAIAVQFLVHRAQRFGHIAGTDEWYQCVVNWLRYRTSIQLIHSFFFRRDTSLFSKMELWCLPPGPRLIWERLWIRYHRFVYRKTLYNPTDCRHHGDWGDRRRLFQSCVVRA